MSSRLATCACACVLFAGGCRTEVRFDEPTDAAMDAVVASDAGVAEDAGDLVDAALEVDAGPPPCGADTDCPLPSLHCDTTTGACVGCILDADCTTPGLPRCDSALHRCIECGTRDDCPTGQTCDGRARRCVPTCASSLECVGGLAECDLMRGVCELCELPADCVATPATPVCDTRTHLCVECVVDTQCTGTTPHCDRVTTRCVQCTEHAQCSVATSVCDPVALVCVAP